MTQRFPDASTELAIQLLGEASLFLDNFCIHNDVSLKIAIAMTMAAADAKGGTDTARAMETALKIITSTHSLKVKGYNRYRRSKSK